MGAHDVERQQLNVFRMQLMGAEVVPVDERRAGRSRTRSTRRCATGRRASPTPIICSAPSPARTPSRPMVREYQRVIGREARAQILERGRPAPRRRHRLRRRRLQRDGPVRRFHRRRGGAADRLRAGRPRVSTGGEHGATLLRGRPGILHGSETYVLQDEDGQINESWSVSAGLDYPAVGPGTCLSQGQRPRRICRRDRPGGARRLRSAGAVRGDHLRLRIRPCPRSCAAARGRGRGEGRESILVVNLSGRGDKDMAQAQKLAGLAGVSRYEAMFERLRGRGEGAFGAFVMLGDPDLETSAAILDAAGRGRRRHARGRHPLLRSGRRRAGDPGGGGAGARAAASGPPIASP